jgi:hypothetical protein
LNVPPEAMAFSVKDGASLPTMSGLVTRLL